MWLYISYTKLILYTIIYIIYTHDITLSYRWWEGIVLQHDKMWLSPTKTWRSPFRNPWLCRVGKKNSWIIGSPSSTGSSFSPLNMIYIDIQDPQVGGPFQEFFPTRKCNCSLQGWPKTLLSEKLLETWGRSSLDSKVPHVSIIFSLWNRIQTYAFHGHAQLNKVGLENVHDSPGSSSLTTIKAYRILYTSPSHLPEPKDSGTKKDVCLSGVWWWGLTEVWTCDAIFPNISKVKPPVTSR